MFGHVVKPSQCMDTKGATFVHSNPGPVRTPGHIENAQTTASRLVQNAIGHLATLVQESYRDLARCVDQFDSVLQNIQQFPYGPRHSPASRTFGHQRSGPCNVVVASVDKHVEHQTCPHEKAIKV